MEHFQLAGGVAEPSCRLVMPASLDTSSVGQHVTFPEYSTWRILRQRPILLLVKASSGLIFFIELSARLSLTGSDIRDIAATVGIQNPYWPDSRAAARLDEAGYISALVNEAIDDIKGSWLTSRVLAEGLLDIIVSRNIGKPSDNIRAEYEGELEPKLYEQITCFISGLDQEVIEIIRTTGNKLTPAAYNFLQGASDPVRLYRKQAVQAYPALLQCLASGGLKAICKAIDTAAPLHDFIVSRLGVRPAAVRALRGLDAGFVSYWSSKPAELLRLLSALPTHLYPNTHESWLLFQQRVEAITKISGLPALALRNQVMLAAACSSKNLALSDLQDSMHEKLLAIEELYSALSTVILWRLYKNRWLPASCHRSRFAEIAVDKFVASNSMNGIQKVALRYKAALIREQGLLSGENRLLAGIQFFKLKGAPFVFDCRSIHPLTSAAELGEEAKVFKNCLADYSLRLFSAVSLVFSVRDVQGRERFSALEITVNENGARPSAHVLQHRAKLNQAPSADCSRAVRSFIGYLNQNTQILTDFIRWKNRISRLSRHDCERLMLLNRIAKALQDSLPKAWPLERLIALAQEYAQKEQP